MSLCMHVLMHKLSMHLDVYASICSLEAPLRTYFRGASLHIPSEYAVTAKYSQPKKHAGVIFSDTTQIIQYQKLLDMVPKV